MKHNSEQPTFYFHDFETFGIHPALDRPAQFAGVRTDANFNIIEEPLVIYCQPADDYLPSPEAVMITGITPQYALANGVNEAEFARQINTAFSRPNSCILGYNNIRFDDEVSRNIFYRNFLDPYAYSWQNGSSRWDLLDMMRTSYALRPDGITWPLNDEGLPSFKLEHLTQANGIEHQNAHDAMADVYATIEMAKLLKQAQPKLFSYLFALRSKHKVTQLVDIAEMTPLVHVSGMFGAYRSNTSLVAPLAWHPDNKNAVIMCDLAGDMTPLLELEASELRQRLYTRKDQLLPDQASIPLKLVHINKCPVLAPLKTLQDAERIELDRQHCLRNWKLLQQNPLIREKVVELFAQTVTFPVTNNVDAQLYDGFFSDADRAAIQIIQQSSPQNLANLDLCFNDSRLKELLFRFRARNYPATLNQDERTHWQLHRQTVLNAESVRHYIQTLNDLAYQYETDAEKVALLKALFEYGKMLTK